MSPKDNVRNKRHTVLVTGNTGYIGPVMTRLLKERSYQVVGLDSNWFGEKLFYPVPENSRPDMQVFKDIRILNHEDLAGIDAVIHLAGLSNDPLGDIDQGLTEEINFKATVRLAEMCKEHGIERFIFASSCSMYGIADGDVPIDETGALNPITAYAKAKVNSEVELAALADDSFHPVFMRNATVYGVSPRLRLDLVVNNLFAWAYVTGEIRVLSDGTPWRPILHIEDFCLGAIAALEAPVDRIHCEAFNVGINEENYRVIDIANEIHKVLPDARVKVLNETGPDERTYRVEFSKIREALPGFKPRWNLCKGITELLEAYRRYGLSSDDLTSERYYRLKTVQSLMKSERIDSRLNWAGGVA